MASQKLFAVFVWVALLLSVALPSVMAQEGAPVSADSAPVALDVPIQRTSTTWELVKGVDGAQDNLVPVTTVELTQKVTVKAAQSGRVQPNATSVQIGNYIFTMARRLVNTPSGAYRYVAAGGYTMANVTAQELRVSGDHKYGSGQCNNPAQNYTGSAYNQTKVDAQQSGNMRFGSGLLHCVVNGKHAAKINNQWPLWLEGQTGPNATF